MVDKKKNFFLRIMIVVVALFLGASLNMFQFHDSFKSTGNVPTPPQQVLKPSAPEESQPAPIAPDNLSTKEERFSSSSPAVALDQAKPAGAELPAAVEPGQTTPSSSGETGGVEPPQETGRTGPSAGAEHEKAVQNLRETPRGRGPELAVVTEPESSLPSGPKVTREPEIVRAAGIGRQVPAESQSSERPDKQSHPEELTQESKQQASDQALPEEKSQGQPESSPAMGKSGPAVMSGIGEQKTAGIKAGKVLEIKAEERPGEFVLTIVTDGPVERVATFHAKDPARLGVDIPGGWQYSGPLVIHVGARVMERVRLGVHQDKLRLVIDYQDKAATGLTEPVIEKLPKGVVIRVILPVAKQ